MYISACIALVLGAGPGSFGEPVRLSAGDGTASDPGAGLIGSTLLVAHIEGDLLILRAAHGDGDPLEIAKGVEKGAEPRVAVGDLGRISVLYLGPGDAPRLLLAESNSGEFGEPVEIASGLGRGAPHDLAHAPRGGLRVLHGSGPESSGLVLISMPGGARHDFQGGAHAALAVDAAGFVHVSCVREGLVRHRTDREAEDFSSETTLEGVAGVRAAAMATAGESVHWLVETQDGIRHGILDPDGVARWSAAVPGHSPALAVSSTGNAVGLHVGNGTLLAAVAAPGELELRPPSPLFTPASSGEIRGHGVRADISGHFHVLFEWDAEVYLMNDVPPPVPSFRAEPTQALQGEPILFEDLSAGIITELDWDFGDGARGQGPSAVHRYLEPGTYAVTLHATGPGGTRSFQLPERIRILPAQNVLEMPRMRAAPASPRVTVPVLLTTEAPIGGFQLAIETSPLLSWSGFSAAGTDTQRLDAELVSVDMETAGARSAVVAAVLWDWEEPYDGRTLPPVESHAVLLLDFDIAPGASAGASLPLSFVSDFGPQRKGSVLAGAEGSASIIPFTRDGVVVVEAQGDGVFLRGDSNGDDRVDISDAIGTLLYLFVGGMAPGCIDAADTNDDGELDISDAVETLQYLFVGGRYPAYPFPAPGLDGTADSLPLCSTP